MEGAPEGAVDFAALVAGAGAEAAPRPPGEATLLEDWHEPSAALGGGWGWVREDDGWSVGEAGQLLLRSARGADPVPNLLLRGFPALPEPDWGRGAQVAVTPSAGEDPGEQAGLVWYRDDGHYLKLAVEVGEGGEPCVVFSVVAGGSPAVVATKECPQAAAGGSPVTLRVELAPDGSTAAAILDMGYCEQLVGVCEDVRALALAADGARIGVTAHGASAEQPPRHATFSRLRLLALAPDRVSFANPGQPSGITVYEAPGGAAAPGAGGAEGGADFAGWTFSEELSEADREQIGGMIAGLGAAAAGQQPAVYSVVEQKTTEG